MLSNKYRAEGFLLGTVVGGVVAGVAALLFAPKSGEELRKDISDQANDLKDQATDYANEAVEKGQAYYEDAKHKGEELSETAKAGVNLYRDNAEVALQEAQDDLNKNQDSDDNIDVDGLTDSLQSTVKDSVERDKEITEEIINQAKRDLDK